MLAIPIALFVLLLVTCALVLRFGVRGRVPVRLLASALHLPARLGLAPATSALHQRLYRASGERLGGWWFGARILVIETTGRRSGKTRHTAVIFVPDGDRFVVTPANGGADKTPAWWLNLRERGRGAVILGGRRLPVLAYEATGSERERLWRLMLSGSPAVAEYQSFTSRHFAVIVLEPGRGEAFPRTEPLPDDGGHVQRLTSPTRSGSGRAPCFLPSR